MTDFEQLQQAMNVMGTIKDTPPPANAKLPEYSGPDGADGATIAPSDPILDTAGVPTAPPITAAQRGKPLPGTRLPAAAPAPQGFEAVQPAITPESPPTPVMGNSGPLRLVLTGASGSGKSTIAKQLGLQELQIQDPIIDLYRRYFPGNEPPVDFMNALLVWGEGYVDPKTPVTPARLVFVDFWRNLERELGLNFMFGTQGYWQKRLEHRASQINEPVAITTCTTSAMLEQLKSAGYKHFHIGCSNQTLGTRKRRQGANDALASAFTNQILREISQRPQGAPLPLIWNDTVPAPSPRFLTLETFRQVIQQSQQTVVTGE